MGQGNAAVKQWIERPDRFADLFNGYVFQGEQVILPEELEHVSGESVLLCWHVKIRRKYTMLCR